MVQPRAQITDTDKKPMRPVRLAATLLIFMAIGAASTGLVLNRLTEPTAPRSWPMDPVDLAALGGVQAAYRGLSDSLAGIVTDSVTVMVGGRRGQLDRAQFIEFVLAPQLEGIAVTRSAVVASAEKRYGVAVEASGTTWVERRGR